MTVAKGVGYLEPVVAFECARVRAILSGVRDEGPPGFELWAVPCPLRVIRSAA